MQLHIEDQIKANDILQSRGESKAELAKKLGLARSTVTNFFMGKSVSQDVFDKLTNYLKIDNVEFKPMSSTIDLEPINISAKTEDNFSIVAHKNSPTIEELKMLHDSKSPYLEHLFTCKFFDYMIENEILIERKILLELLGRTRLPLSWCGYIFYKSTGGYKILKQ